MLTLIAVVVLFQSPIKKLLNFIIIDPVISFCPQNVGADLVFGIFGFNQKKTNAIFYILKSFPLA